MIKETLRKSVMKRTHVRIKCSNPLIAVASICFMFICLFSLIFGPTNSSSSTRSQSLSKSETSGVHQAQAFPEHPRFAYFISGTKGDAARLERLVLALYHPRNYYLLHLDADAPDVERLELARFAKSERVMREFRNVMVIGKGDLITSNGPTMIASTLHAVAILLKRAQNWDWFINLSASDYPLMPQDDILHIFSYLPRDLNFVEHTSKLGWKEFQRARPIIIDPALYHLHKYSVFSAKEKRSIPAAFKVFSGSEWMVLTRSFLYFCIWGWDNLPRTLLMYYTNFLSSQESYFHTAVCNNKNYQNTTVNHDLHFMKWDNPPKQQPLNLTLDHFDDMVRSGSPFARTFAMDDPVLNKIDGELLRRSDGQFTPGGWCRGTSNFGKDPCVYFGSSDVIKPSVNSRRLESLIVELLDHENFRTRQCK